MTYQPVGPYSATFRAGNLLFCSGQIGIDDEQGLVDGGLLPQIRQAFANLRSILADERVVLENVVKTTVFLVDMADFVAMNEVYAEEFGDHRPARSTIAVAGLPKGAQFEIEAIVAIG